MAEATGSITDYRQPAGEFIFQQIKQYTRSVNLARQKEGEEQLMLHDLDIEAIVQSIMDYHPTKPWLVRLFRPENPLDARVKECKDHYAQMESGKRDLEYFEQPVMSLIAERNLEGLDAQYYAYIKRRETLEQLATSKKYVGKESGLSKRQRNQLAGCFERQAEIDNTLRSMTHMVYRELKGTTASTPTA